MVTLDTIVLDSRSTALIVIDVVNDILEDGFRYNQKGWDRTLMREMVSERLMSFIKQSKPHVKIIFVNSEYEKDTFANDRYPITDFCIRGSPGTDFYMLDQSDADVVHSKKHWSAFLKHRSKKHSALHLWLKEQGINRLIMTGITFTHCMPINIGHAFALGYEVYLPRDLVASRSDRMDTVDGHNAKLRFYEAHRGIRVVNSCDIRYR